MAIRADGKNITLPTGESVGPRFIVECKDEHDFDPRGIDYGKRLIRDMQLLADKQFIAATEPQKAAFTMLKQ